MTGLEPARPHWAPPSEGGGLPFTLLHPDWSVRLDSNQQDPLPKRDRYQVTGLRTDAYKHVAGMC